MRMPGNTQEVTAAEAHTPQNHRAILTFWFLHIFFKLYAGLPGRSSNIIWKYLEMQLNRVENSTENYFVITADSIDGLNVDSIEILTTSIHFNALIELANM